MKETYNVLTIASSDNSGGAGLEADIKTISSLGCYAAVAISGIAVENTVRVQAVYPVTPHQLDEQIVVTCEDIRIDAVKIGLLPTKELVAQTAKTLRNTGLKNIVIDPVLVAACGDSLADTDIIGTYISELFPLASVITPNRFEAEQLFVHSPLQNILQSGAKSILLKGGHSDDVQEVIDELWLKDEANPVKYFAKRIKTNNLHGTGCTLSSAIASFLSIYDGDIVLAVEKAKEYITSAIEAGKNLSIGKGNGPVNHIFSPVAMLTRD
ncbi:MAG: bifunctional hydroxymethylpyrimidine kinase/phosphomethylpyrimidine kinase [Bacteroidales bacterium]|jgi:hydroxymethylpyrimidine/phosphomethylpyrimidine kinase|nr:bifunctional hydroxymethylpyrimidine kinase/phosphomethylpyrimidine kinase [Bacteroidales bacterium]